MKFIFLALVTVLTFNAQAKVVGQAGCGLGNQLLGAEPGPTQIVAATTNGFYGNQTFGISSGSSNCIDKEGTASVEAFVEANQIALNNDISRGYGETVATLSTMLSCANTNVAKKSLQGNYEKISSQKSPVEMTATIKETLRNATQAGCSAV